MREKWSEEMYKRLPKNLTLLDFDEWLTTKTKGKDWDIWFHGPCQDNKNSESKDDKTLQTSKTKTKKGGEIDNQSRHHQRYAQQQSTSTVQQTNSRRKKRQTNAALFLGVCAAEWHKIEDCPVFTSIIPNKRAETIFSNNHCMTCLF